MKIMVNEKVKVNSKIISVHAMKAYGGMEV
jgi:hypothetical protein